MKHRPKLFKLTAASGIMAGFAWFGLPFAIEIPAALERAPSASPILRDRNGVIITHLPLVDATRCRPVAFSDFPRDLIDSTLAAEDKRFFQHGGIDLLASLRSARDCVMKRRVVSGASTITQQLVKITSPPARRTLATKVRESLVARRLEMTWSKERIITEYLNRLDFGNRRFGAAEAVRFYFQKPLRDLSLAESALLAGLPQAPSKLNPIRHPTRSEIRRNTVLHRLANNRMRDRSAVAIALAESVNVRPLTEYLYAPWLSHTAPQNAEVATTLDLKIQKDIEAIVLEETALLREKNLRHAAVVVIENSTGNILALVSSGDWSDNRGGQINGALIPRSPGSTLKPFTYLLAVERNYRNPCSILSDIPTPFRTEQGLNLPENYDKTFRGPVTMRTALACSLNIPAMRELNELGGPRSLHQLMKDLEFTTLASDPAVYGLGLTLGNAPVSLLEITNAYATLARQGDYLKPRLSASNIGSKQKLFAAQSSYLIADILADSQARAPAFDPGGPLDLPFRCAVKTGTSSDFRDNWCIGFTPEFTIGVWAGNFEGQPMKGISGVTGAAPIFNRSMQRLHQDVTPTWYRRPTNLMDVSVDPRNGKIVAADFPGAMKDCVIASQQPLGSVPSDYDEAGKSILDATYREWYMSAHNLRRNELSMGELRSAEKLRIISPADNSVYLIDPEIPSGSARLRPVTNLPGAAVWNSETLQIEPGHPEPVIHLKVGTHVIRVTDPTTGHTEALTVSVKNL